MPRPLWAVAEKIVQELALSIEFQGSTRGMGKLFLLFRADCPVGAEVTGHAEHGGRTLPCYIAPAGYLGKDCYVAVLAALKVSQRLTIEVRSGDSVLESKAKTVNHDKTALASKYNTFRKRGDLERVRNLDLRGLADEAEITFLNASPYPEKREFVMRFEFKTVCHGDINAAPAYSIELLDRSLAEVPHSELTNLGCKVAEREDGCSVVAGQFSFRISEVPHEYVLLLNFADGRVSDGFYISLENQTANQFGDGRWQALQASGLGPRYMEWFMGHHKTSASEIEAQRHHHFAIEPKFSVIVPLFNTPAGYFTDMLNSVLTQTYANLELILVNASPENAELKEAVVAAEGCDERVKVVTLADNYGITENTNEGIKAATGDFLSFFDHDDILEPDLLFEYVKAINAHPETDLLYCDEDKIDDSGKYFQGLLKPDFDWHLICACNYVCHLMTVRKSVVDAFEELPDKRYDGSQDHNMTLRVAEQARNIYHVRKVLYHWRVHPGSTAAGPGEKPWTQESGRVAIQEHLDRIGANATVSDHPTMGNFYVVDYAIPELAPKVSIVIPNKDCASYLAKCIASLYENNDYPEFEVIVVENNSEEQETFSLYEELKSKFENLKVVSYEGGFNFSKICNFGAACATGDLLLFLNNDTEAINADWLSKLVSQIQREDVGAVGAKLLYADGTIQHNGIVFPRCHPMHVDRLRPSDTNGYFGFLQFAHERSAVTGACLLVRKAGFDQIGGFDEQFVVCYNDVDLCLRIRKLGKLVVVEPRAQLYHYESVSRGLDNVSKEKELRFTSEMARLMSMYPELYVADPYYNVNCERGLAHYQLGWS